MRLQLRSVIAALGIIMVLALPAHAAETSADRLTAQIDQFLAYLGPQSHGVLTWDGSDPYQVREEDGEAVAIIRHARLSVHGKVPAQIAFDRVEFRLAPVKDDPALTKLSIVLPEQSTLTTADGSQITLTLNDATANAVIEAATGRTRDTSLSVASGRVDDARSGVWISFGPLTSASKLTIAADGAWTGPASLELAKVAFSGPNGAFEGTIGRLSYKGDAAGPRFAALETMRDRLDALRRSDGQDANARTARFLALLPAIPGIFSGLRGKAELDGLMVRKAAGEPLVVLAKVTMESALTGFSGDTAAFRLTLHQEGLHLSPSLFPDDKVPHRIVVDLGLENLSTAALRGVLDAAAKMGPGADEQQKQQATVAMMGAAATLTPTFRIYDIALDTKDVGVDMTGKAAGSPLLPTGYQASGDIAVRGFDAIPTIAAGAPYLDYLPLLRELGTDGVAADGTKRVEFHLASTPQKPITINGNDVSGWFARPTGQKRLLKPAQPAMRGADVAAVQHALNAAHIPVETDGVYRAATAAAVARFQKANGINVSGVVDPATRDKLGVKDADPAPLSDTPGRN